MSISCYRTNLALVWSFTSEMKYSKGMLNYCCFKATYVYMVASTGRTTSKGNEAKWKMTLPYDNPRPRFEPWICGQTRYQLGNETPLPRNIATLLSQWWHKRYDSNCDVIKYIKYICPLHTLKRLQPIWTSYF